MTSHDPNTKSVPLLEFLFTSISYSATTWRRFRDNVHLIFMNILPLLPEPVRQAVMAFLQSLYGVPIKWEPSGRTVTWGECSWGARVPGFSLTRKGVVHG